MPVATLGMLDLSIVTDGLRAQLETCIAKSPLWGGGPPAFQITVNPNAPDVARTGGGCQLCLYLFHVAQDKFQINSLTSNSNGGYPRAPGLPYHPLAVDLYYLLSASSTDGGYLEEQKAMSIAMRCFHEHPIIATTVPFGPAHPEQYTLTMDIESIDELGRLWQATTSAIRLSAVYRVSVIFISPEAPPEPGPPVKKVNVFVGTPQGTRATVIYRPKESTVADPLTKAYDLTPATVTPGQPFILYGVDVTGQRIYLTDPAGGETDRTIWINPAIETPTSARVALSVPGNFGPALNQCPDPGLYRITVGQGTERSASLPLVIAAPVTGIANPPILNAVAGLYSITGAGFAGEVQVFLDTIALNKSNAAPIAGEFLINGTATQIDLRAPQGLATGLYGLRLRVNGSESPPSWWLDVP